ncbi:hypothetical protein [Streptomyces rhizosphaericus]|uniref:hypothetical protein n=1 Tax=Streptomyces rhizosphaericus TaxID=114699 RepID=UPI000A399CC3|nr:hypothetical protein [Streptomyces rhizosphaericus]
MTRRLLLSYLAPALLVLMGLEIPLGCCYAHGEESPFAQGAEHDASMLTEVAEGNIEKRNLETLPELTPEYADDTGARVVVVGSAVSVPDVAQPHFSYPLQGVLVPVPAVREPGQGRAARILSAAACTPGVAAT